MIDAMRWIAQQGPIIIKLEPPQKDNGIQGFSDVLFASLGLTGVIALGCLIVGGVLGVLMFWFRSRSES